LRAVRWLLDIGKDIPAPVRGRLLTNVFGSLTIYVGAVFNTIIVASVLAARIDSSLLYAWAIFELLLAAVRFRVLLSCRRAVRTEREAPVDLYVILSLMWGAGIGFGTVVVVLSADWIAAAMAGMSSAAMLGGLAVRFFAAPRLACAMLVVSTLPGAIACALSGELILLIAAVQMPLYVAVMTRAAWWMNRIMVASLCAEHENGHRARHDALTGLKNRTGLADAVAQAPADVRLGCLFLDLDGFKRVNDTMGHSAGDDLLAMVAARLRDAMQPGDIVARIGGDEFLLIAPMTSATHARVRGEAMIAAVAGLPYVIGSHGVLIGASVGAALQGEGSGGLDELIADADEALYRAKSDDRCCCVVADDSEEREAARPLRPTLRDLRTVVQAAQR
jgi:diguanylate cyclase (GGDEF)-like protein